MPSQVTQLSDIAQPGDSGRERRDGQARHGLRTHQAAFVPSCLEMMHAFCAWNPHQAPNRISACEELSPQSVQPLPLRAGQEQRRHGPCMNASVKPSSFDFNLAGA
ncbi:hypothetical protein TgHK011_009231 [Trichoderma gracile]|nr:hypothetical protein TgHK011_009231 [Trichoderma gracile]